MKPLKLIGWGVLAIVALIAVVFAIHNYGAQKLDFWPLPYTVIAPLYAVIIAALAIGFVLGALASWVAGRNWRRLARLRKRENDTLMRELDGFKSKARERALPAPADAGPRDEPAPPRAAAGKDG
jgi:uncharacterized integral membrane protein